MENYYNNNLQGISEETLELIKIILLDKSLKENARKELLISFLPRIFPQDKYRRHIQDFTSGSESFIPTAPSSESISTKGFIDTLNGQMIVEFKKDVNNKNSYNTGILELKRYIAGLWTTKGVNASYACLITDVLNWKLFRPIPNEVTVEGIYNADMVELQLTDSIEITNDTLNEAEHLTSFLQRVLLEGNLLLINAKNIKNDFGIKSNLFKLVEEDIFSLVYRASKTSDAKLSMELWSRYQSYNIANINDVDLSLYTKQIYLVLLSRLLVANTLEETLPNNDRTIQIVLNGDFFRNNYKINNLVDYDFFGWVLKEEWFDYLFPIARILLHNIKMYDFSNIKDSNIIQLIYDEMLPLEQKALYGQTSTPLHLAENIIDELLYNPNPNFKYLDPACGCGNFIRASLIKTLDIYKDVHNADKLLNILKSSVTGIDIDPIAIILTKAVWAITLADIIKQVEKPIDIPIYNADSLFIISHDDNENPKIAFDNTIIEIPSVLLKNPDAFDNLIKWCNAKAHYGVKNNKGFKRIETEEIINKLFKNDLYIHLNIEDKQLLLNSINLLIAELRVRILQNRDGIWAFVINNSYRPTLIAGQFDYIATNPPWLTVSKIANAPYKTQLINHSKFFNINPKGSSFLHTEISTTFVLHNVKHFLKMNGKAAFILSRSIIDGDNHAPFREFSFSSKVSFKITDLWDLITCENLFKVPSCVLFIEKNDNYNKINNLIPTRLYSESLEIFKTVTYGLSSLLDKNAWLNIDDYSFEITANEYYKSKFKQGADLMPRLGLFIDILDDINSNKNIYHIKTSEIEIANKLNKKLKDFRQEDFINKKYIFETVTSNVVLPFIILENKLPKLVLPVEEKNNKLHVISIETLIDYGEYSLVKWLENVNSHKDTTKDISTTIDTRNKLTQQQLLNFNYIVHCGAGGSKPCAAVQRNHKESNFILIADQTTYSFGTNSEEEALYLTGILNSQYVSDIIKPFQARGMFGERHIHTLVYKLIPPFDEENLNHKKISQYTKSIEDLAFSIIEQNRKLQDLSRTIQMRRKQLLNEIILSNNMYELLNITVEKTLNIIKINN